jgi:hypothetical protein
MRRACRAILKESSGICKSNKHGYLCYVLLKQEKEHKMITITVRVKDHNGQRWQDVIITKQEIIQIACDKVADMYDPKPDVDYIGSDFKLDINCT